MSCIHKFNSAKRKVQWSMRNAIVNASIEFRLCHHSLKVMLRQTKFHCVWIAFGCFSLFNKAFCISPR